MVAVLLCRGLNRREQRKALSRLIHTQGLRLDLGTSPAVVFLHSVHHSGAPDTISHFEYGG